MRALSLWFIKVETIAEVREVVDWVTMPELKEVVNRVLLPLQLSLGIWQIMKLTPLWAVMCCTMAYLLTRFYLLARSYFTRFSFPDADCNKVKGFTCFSFWDTDYNKLKGFEGRVFKKVITHATTAGDVAKVKKHKDPKESNNPIETVSVVYLGKTFELERKERYKMSMKNGPAYYITDKMWENVKYIAKVAEGTVFVKDHKEIWEEVITGDIMEFEEVLDSVILDNRAVIRLDQDYFLPVNLLKSEDKLLKILNLVGLFLQAQKHIHRLLPASLTFTSAVMGFSTTGRLSVDRVINEILCRPFCSAVRLLCDRLPLAMRRRVYFWGNWVEHLKPSNDLQSKTVRGDICALVAAGAKADRSNIRAPSNDSESLADCESLADRGNIRALVGGAAKACLETFIDLEICLVILADQDNICALLAGDAKAQLEPFVHFQSSANVGPYLFKCDSAYIEWIFDNTNHKCSLKAGRTVASQKSLIAHDIYIVCDDDDCRKEEDVKFFTCASFCGQEEHVKSLIAEDIETASVDVECSSNEAIKLFKFAFYMAHHKSGSLKSYDRNTNTVYVRRFVESINAYVRSRYPPLHKLDLKNVVVR